VPLPPIWQLVGYPCCDWTCRLLMGMGRPGKILDRVRRLHCHQFYRDLVFGFVQSFRSISLIYTLQSFSNVGRVAILVATSAQPNK
jgi:hypothetical protein